MGTNDRKKIVIDSKPIAYGRKSKIYKSGSKVIKLYEKNFSREKIEREFKNAKLIYRSGKLLVPEPLSLIEFNNHTGIEFEYIAGQSLMDIFQKNPLEYFSYQKKIADVHRSIHQITVKEIPLQKHTFEELIVSSTRLENLEKDMLLSILNQKHKAALCHGDFHHGNLIQTASGKIYITDWMDAFSGNPLLDVALTAVNAAVSTAPPHIPKHISSLYELAKKIFRLDTRYINVYGAKNSNELKEQIMLAAGIHLSQFQEQDPTLHRIYFNKAKYI